MIRQEVDCVYLCHVCEKAQPVDLILLCFFKEAVSLSASSIYSWYMNCAVAVVCRFVLLYTEQNVPVLKV